MTWLYCNCPCSLLSENDSLILRYEGRQSPSMGLDEEKDRQKENAGYLHSAFLVLQVREGGSIDSDGMLFSILHSRELRYRIFLKRRRVFPYSSIGCSHSSTHFLLSPGDTVCRISMRKSGSRSAGAAGLYRKRSIICESCTAQPTRICTRPWTMSI